MPHRPDTGSLSPYFPNATEREVVATVTSPVLHAISAEDTTSRAQFLAALREHGVLTDLQLRSAYTMIQSLANGSFDHIQGAELPFGVTAKLPNQI